MKSLRDRVSLERAANGHVMLSILKPRLRDRLVIRWKLQVSHRFHRAGKRVWAPDESIALDYIRGNLRLEAGHDHWAGLYLLASDENGDRFLEDFAQELSKMPESVGNKAPGA